MQPARVWKGRRKCTAVRRDTAAIQRSGREVRQRRVKAERQWGQSNGKRRQQQWLLHPRLHLCPTESGTWRRLRKRRIRREERCTETDDGRCDEVCGFECATASELQLRMHSGMHSYSSLYAYAHCGFCALSLVAAALLLLRCGEGSACAGSIYCCRSVDCMRECVLSLFVSASGCGWLVARLFCRAAKLSALRLARCGAAETNKKQPQIARNMRQQTTTHGHATAEEGSASPMLLSQCGASKWQDAATGSIGCSVCCRKALVTPFP